MNKKRYHNIFLVFPIPLGGGVAALMHIIHHVLVEPRAIIFRISRHIFTKPVSVSMATDNKSSILPKPLPEAVR